MDLQPYVDNVRHELRVAAAAGGAEAEALADRLTAPLESSIRLALLEALSEAADLITRDVAPGSVEVRLRGRDPEFTVTAGPEELPEAPAVAPADEFTVTAGVEEPARRAGASRRRNPTMTAAPGG